jgi:hypothetical protein
MWIQPPASPAMMIQSFARVQHCADASQVNVAIVEPLSSSHTFTVWSADAETASRAVRRHRNGVDRGGVALESPQCATALELPHLERLVGRRGDRLESPPRR